MSEDHPGNLPLGSNLDPSVVAGGVEVDTLAFDGLRTTAYEQMGRDIAARLAANPTPTPEERLLGTYVEALEPQVRAAVLAMRAKGYNTTASGFHSTDDDWRVMGIDNPSRTYDPANRRAQFMDFRETFSIADGTRQRLNALGAVVLVSPDSESLRIGFVPMSPDLRAIEAQWNAIADALPDTGAAAGPRMGSLEATGFGIYCPQDVNWPMDQFNAAMAGQA